MRDASTASLTSKRYRDTGIQGYRDTGMQGYRDTGIQDTGIPGYRDTEIQGYRDTGIQGYRDTGIRVLSVCSYKNRAVRFDSSISTAIACTLHTNPSGKGGTL